MSISIIIPTYNRADKLGRCLQSLINQSYKGYFDIIIIDDSSTDNTLVTARKFIKDNPYFRIRYLRNIKNMGVAYSRNRGIRSTRAKTICMIDDDIVADKDWLYAVSKHIIRYPVIVGKINPADDNIYNRLNMIKTRAIRKFLMKSLRRNNHALLSTGNCAISRTIFEKIGLFDESLRSSEDKDFRIRMMLSKIPVKYVDKMLGWHENRKDLFSFLSQRFWYGRGDFKIERKWGKKVIYENTIRIKVHYKGLYKLLNILAAVAVYLGGTYERVSTIFTGMDI